MEPIPGHCKNVADRAADEKRHDDKHRRGDKNERPDRQLKMDHVRPKNEVIERLPPIQRNEQRPNQMPASKENPDSERGFGWTKMVHGHSLFVEPFPHPPRTLAQRLRARPT